MGYQKKSMVLAGMLIGILVFSAGILNAAEPGSDYDRIMKQAEKDQQEKKYREAAAGFSKAFFLAGTSEARRKAAELSAVSDAAARKAGDEIKGTVSVVADPSAGKLYLLEDETVRKVYDMICNPDHVPPAGIYAAGSKLSYPNYELNGILHKRLTGKNPLGSRWIEIRTAEGRGIFGIHGRSEATQKGLLFFSLSNLDINDLFRLLAEGGRIEIK